ncbi:hypothetical protein [Shewanella denitrificans]|jgi:hypothetical protein|uniref:hypothetical protein n=1 Tax=Shewanella denitrificans TaxID=192073 RepID=UPI0012F737AB|nr:hypothetical protein [Shewanella denitrificans]
MRFTLKAACQYFLVVLKHHGQPVLRVPVKHPLAVDSYQGELKDATSLYCTPLTNTFLRVKVRMSSPVNTYQSYEVQRNRTNPYQMDFLLFRH